MNKSSHFAIYGSEFSTRSRFFKKMLQGEGHPLFSVFKHKKTVLFSNVSLEKFIEEELAHDAFDLSSTMGRSIRTLSSGEQKKALLKHLLKQEPELIILDNPFDALDIASVAALKKHLLELSQNHIIIQLFKRIEDRLPFIEEMLFVDQERVVYEGKITDFFEQRQIKTDFFCGEIPHPLEKIEIESEELIRMDKVNVSYDGRAILKDINWCIHQGEFWQLIGPNGSGKTTLLTMIDGDNPKAYGQDIYLFGQRKGSGETVWDIKKKVGYFTPAMMELFKARRHTAQGMIIGGLHDSIGLYNIPSDAQVHLANQWLKVLGLEKTAQKAFVDLSQVEQRMVLIARAMIKHPPVLILDEPSNGLDDKAAALLVALINKIATETDSALLYVSHRSEKGLAPQHVLELIPGEMGSIGVVT